jgi:hypothetical protein
MIDLLRLRISKFRQDRILDAPTTIAVTIAPVIPAFCQSVSLPTQNSSTRSGT